MHVHGMSKLGRFAAEAVMLPSWDLCLSSQHAINLVHARTGTQRKWWYVFD